jgi:UDP-N-acetylmuramate--alanine ligase
VRETNPELIAARSAHLRVLHRSQALAALMLGRRGVAVAGTHGKTTTTSMLTVTLQHCGADPSFAIGGELTEGGANARDGSGDTFVAEADESDGSFLLYRPAVSIITNVEPDHHDHYGTAEAVEAAFDAFADRVLPGGTLVACRDDPGAARVAARAAARRPDDLVVCSYGTHAGADVRVLDVDGAGAGVGFTLQAAGERFGPVRLRVPGRHNALNAAAAWTAATALGVDGVAAAAGLATFGGTRRRFEAKGVADGVRVFDDYAHHPTEVEAVLRAARGVAAGGAVVAVFQPHLFSRTRIFAADFGRALALADRVVVLDVYAAREDPEPGVTGALVSAAVPLPADRVTFAPTARDGEQLAVLAARPGDLVLTIGAGDVTRLGPRILAALEARSRQGAGAAEGPG